VGILSTDARAFLYSGVRFVTYIHGNKRSAGLIRGQFVYDLAQAYFRQFRRPYKFPSLLEYLQSGLHEKLDDVDLNAMRDDRLVAIPIKEARFAAPIPRPPKIVCVGLNYKDHAAEQKKEPPKEPLLFAKAPNAVVADGEEIRIPYGISEKVDYEVELGVVIGTEGYRIAKSAAMDHVFGYTVFNDVTARDLQQSDKQWFRAKSFATFAPMGPSLVTREELDARSVGLVLTVNGEIRQQGSTADMIFDVPALIEYASAAFALEVGDVIATGTPAGVGVFRNPPVFLKSGDRVGATIEGIGTLTNVVR
jgi:2,4-didehydro-3-deoxy-L-rhamnonate hydrolase